MSYSNYEQKIVLNGFALSGVQDVNGSYGISEQPLRIAGVGFVDALIESPLEGNFSISRDMVSRDPLVELNSIDKYTYDEDFVSGAILYDNDTKGFGFTKGRVSRYSVSCSVGQIPTIDLDIRVFGELGQHVLSEETIEINTAFANYPYNGDFVYYTNLNGDLIDTVIALPGYNANVKDEWNAGTLDIDADTYNSLYDTSRIVINEREDYEAYVDNNPDLLAYYNSEDSNGNPLPTDNLWDYDPEGPVLTSFVPVQSKTKSEFGKSHFEQHGRRERRSMYYSSEESLGLGKNAFVVEATYNDIATNQHPPIQFADQSSISIDVDDFAIDAISDFSFSRTINMNPVYAIPKGTSSNWDNNQRADHKNLEPVQVDTQYPIETDINFTMIVDEYEIRKIKDRIQSAPKSNVVINIRDAKTDGMMNSFTGHNVRLISESINASVEGEMAISLTYKGYDTLHNPVS